MDSFFSLFDPTEGQSSKTKKNNQNDIDDSVKKKSEGKGRRRGKKSRGKNETLPEESSFLCEPDLSTDLLMKEGTYIDSYYESSSFKDSESTQEEAALISCSQNALKKRNFTKKCRRKRNKTSPFNENASRENIQDIPLKEEILNNSKNIKKINDTNIGKNVNNLQRVGGIGVVGNVSDTFQDGGNMFDDYLDSSVRVNNMDGKQMFLHTNKQSMDLHDFLYKYYNSSDLDSYTDEDELYNSSSDIDDSEDETYGYLPPEPRFGNVEYKLQLVKPCEKRLQHLVTQLKWRLASGGGVAVYILGVRDCGAVRGLKYAEMGSSLLTLARMGAALDAKATVTVSGVGGGRAVAEARLRKLAEPQQSEVRIAVMGANEAGKSTLIGVLTQGELDNGEGSARLNMFRHVHEIRSGRTSSLSHEILGFDALGNVVNYGCSELMTAERIGSASCKLVSFLDLAGHSKYQRTTVRGLSGYLPHQCMLVVSATAGITNMTEEHIGLLLALELPFFTVVNKCEIATKGIDSIVERLADVLRSSNKKPLLINDEQQARDFVLNKQRNDSENNGLDNRPKTDLVPVFPVSCVKGLGLSALHAYLLHLSAPEPETARVEEEPIEFQIDEIFHVNESAGPVVGGLMISGRLAEGGTLLIGPLLTGEFVEITVKSIYRNRVPCDSVRSGQSASLGLSNYPPNLRQGMVLLSIPEKYYYLPKKPTFGACPPGKCKTNGTAQNGNGTVYNMISKSKFNQTKIEKRKNKNFYKDLILVEKSLVKNVEHSSNIYKNDDDDDLSEECRCDDKIYLDDPNDPRGCFYFQASIHLLNHTGEFIYPGFECTVHIGNVRQTAVIVGVLAPGGVVKVGARASLLLRFNRMPEYIRPRRTVLWKAGGTSGVGTIQQIFPHVV